MSTTDTCRICQKPKQTAQGDLFNQFIESCRCDALREAQTSTITVCANCGKRIPNRAGSITQWVFKQGNCECQRPQAVEQSVDSFIQPAFEGFREDAEEIELDLSSDDFPTDRYKAVTKLGSGASGVVYLCRDRMLGKKVAVKTLHNLAGDQLISFQKEARATARLQHPYIVKVLDFGATETGTPYMVIDYVPGLSLETYIQNHGRLEEELATSIFSKLAEALEYAHNQKVYHRDLKPSNIILYETKHGIDVRLIDFGIAKVKEESGLVTIYQDKTLAGTPNYMSPDPMLGSVYDSQSEIYSLGCVMFEALTGWPPFTAETALEVLAKHAREKPPSLSEYIEDASPELEFIVAKCLAKAKSERFGSMGELKVHIDGSSKASGEKQGSDITVNDTNTAADREEQHSSNPGIINRRSLLIASAFAVIAISTISLSFFALRSLHPLSTSPSRSSSNLPKPNDQEVSYFISSAEDSDKPYLVDRGRGEYIVQGHIKPHPNSLDLIKDRKDIRALDFSQNDLRGKTLHVLPTTNIQTLSLNYCDLDNQSMEYIGMTKSLNILSLINCKIDNSNLQELQSLKNLQYLSIWGIAATDQKVKNLCYFQNLRRLGLRDCRSFTPNTIKLVATLPKLVELDVVGSPLNKIHINDLKNIKTLDALQTTVFSRDLAEVLKDLKIRRLVIAHNREITDKELLAVSIIKTLLYLEIKECKNVTPNFKIYMKQVNKNCIVNIVGSSLVAPLSIKP